MKAITKVLALTALAMMMAVGLCSLLQSDDSSADSVETDYDHYFYNQLDPLGKEVFDRWMTMYPRGGATGTFQFDIDLSMLPTTDLSEVNGAIKAAIDDSSSAAIYAFGNERYDVFWLKNSLAWRWDYWYNGDEITRIEITYTVYFVNDYPDPYLARTEVFDALCSIDVDETNTYTKVRSIHDATVKTLSYAAYTDDSNFTIRSVFRDLAGDHSVVCEGYAKMFKALCDLYDVPCLLISGYGDSEAHMWNYVMMDDGKWYAVDCTWDDQDVIFQTYFLVGNDTLVFNGNTYSQDHVIGDRMEYLSVPDISDDAYEAYHTVYFVGEGSKVETVDVEHGATIDVASPTWRGYTFLGWLLDGDPFDTDTPVTADMTLYAEWTLSGVTSGTVDGITWSINTDTRVMTINGTGAIPDFERGDAPWYANYNNIIMTVIIGSGITTIGSYSFYNMLSFTSVSLPSSVTAVHSNAFSQCYKLADVCIADGGIEPTEGSDSYGGIAKYCYWVRHSGVSPIEKVSVEGGILYYYVGEDFVTVIDADVTDDTITFPESLGGYDEYSIAHHAFYQNTKVRNVVMLSDSSNSGVTVIGDYAFYLCLNLNSVGFTEYLKDIGVSSFDSCIHLQAVHLPSSLLFLGERAFYACSGLTVVDMSSCDVDCIESEAFGYCTNLSEVVMSNNTHFIREGVFAECGHITRLTFPASLIEVSANVFTGMRLSIGGVVYNDIPGGDASARAAAVEGKSFSCLDTSVANPVLVEDVYLLYYIVDGVIEAVVDYAAGDEVTLADLPSDVGHVYKGWYIPGMTIVDGKITMPANTLYVFAHSYIQYYTVTIDLGDGTVPGYAGIWDEVDSHTYALDIAGGTDIEDITTDDTSNLFFDSGDIVIDGYSFDHWVAYSPIVNGPLDITAYYVPAVYDLVLGNGAGTVAYNATSITITTEPTSAGFHVVGYSVDVDEVTYTLADAEGNLAADVPGYTDSNGRWIRTSGATVSPSFLGNTYDVVLDKNGGDTGGTAKVVFHDCGLSQITAPTRDEYILTGYYLEAGCETRVANADGSFVNSLDGYIQTGAWVRTSGVTLYAKWELPTYAITLDGNGGTAGSATATHGSPTATGMTDCTMTGYTLKGYYLEPECYRLVLLGDTFKPNITGYTDGSGNWIAETGVTLYAKWSANMISMTLNKKEGTGNGQSYIYYGTSEIYTITSPGWLLHHPVAFYLDEGRTVLLYTIVDGEEVLECGVDGFTDANGVWIYPTAGTIDLYTGWAGNQVNLVFDGNGGSDGSAVAVHDSAVLTGVSHSVRSGYTLDGYYSASTDALVVTSAGQLVANVDTYTDSDGKWIGYNDMYALVDTVHLQARWTPITYDVVLDRNGGTADGSATVVFDSASLNEVFE